MFPGKGKIMRYRIMAVAYILLMGTGSPSEGGGRGSDGAPEGGGPQALGKFIGSWRGEVEVHPAGGRESTYVAGNTFSWVLGGRFARDEGGDISDASSNMGMWTYDPAVQAYRSWYFLAPGGEVVAFTYRWVERDQAFRGRADLGGGMVMEAEDRFQGKDAYEWRLVLKDKDGKALNRMTGRMKRVR